MFLRKAAFSGKALWISLGLMAANLMVYAAVWHHPFVNYDDPQYVIDNLHVTGGLTWNGVLWAFTTGYFSNWHPLTWLSHMLDVQLYGLSAGKHHLTNVILHVANSILLFGFLHGTTRARWRSAFVAAIFAVHPLHVESVAWIAERKDVLSTFFWMLTLWAYVGYVRQPEWRRYGTVLLLFACGLMAKPMLVTLPFVLLLLDFWPLGRLRFAGNSTSATETGGELRRPALNLIMEKLPLFTISVVSSVVMLHVQRESILGSNLLPFRHRAANAIVSYFAYIGKSIWPVKLAAFYPYHASNPLQVAGSILGVLALSCAVILAARRKPYLAVGWFWFIGTLMPVIGVIQVGEQSMADRYTYVPQIGLAIVVAWGIMDFFAQWPRLTLPVPSMAGLAIVLCILMARTQVVYWSNSVLLWEHALKVTDDNYIAHANLGAALAARGRNEEAIPELLEALRIAPDFPAAHNNLGLVLEREGRFNEAYHQFSEALRTMPDMTEAHRNMGRALATQGRTSEAIREYSEALRINPDDLVARRALQELERKEGVYDSGLR